MGMRYQSQYAFSMDFFSLLNIFSLLNVLTQPAANLPRVANIVMSQSNAVSSSLPGNLAGLLILQHQISFCYLSLASFCLLLPRPDFVLIYTPKLLLINDLQ